MGGKSSPTRRTWYAMVHRSDGRSSRDRYFDRGIGVSDDWRIFENFLRDMGVKPDGLTLERIDNDKGYSKENCKWATPAEQNRNRRSTLRLKVGDQTLCGRDAARLVGIPESIIYKRLKQGMSPEEALTKPPQARFKFLTFQGETLHAKEWAKRMGIGCYTFYRRLDAGWPIEKVITTPVRNKSGSYKEWNGNNSPRRLQEELRATDTPQP